MKILMVSNYFNSHPGGIEAVAGELFRRLARPDCHVTWAAADVSLPPMSSAKGNGLSLNSWNGVEKAVGLPFPVPSPIALGQLWSAVGACDVVLLHDCLYLSNIAAFVFARVRQIPVVIVQHIGTVPFGNFAVATLMKVANLLVTKPMLRGAEQVAFISQITQRHFSGLCFVHPPILVFNGADTNIFSPPADDSVRAALRTPLGLPTDKPVGLFVGRFVQKKGLQILKEMASRDPEIVWAFAGSGPINPGDWGLANVKVYSDLHGTSLADLYRTSDVFVLPSTGEGFPLVIQEALACGLPVACSAETATADDALIPFVRGVPLGLNDQQSADNFLLATRELLNETGSQEMRARRFCFVQSRYSWARIVDRYFRIVSELIPQAKDLNPHQKRTGASTSSNAKGVGVERSRP